MNARLLSNYVDPRYAQAKRITAGKQETFILGMAFWCAKMMDLVMDTEHATS
jgi:hypothetical protein